MAETDTENFTNLTVLICGVKTADPWGGGEPSRWALSASARVHKIARFCFSQKGLARQCHLPLQATAHGSAQLRGVQLVVDVTDRRRGHGRELARPRQRQQRRPRGQVPRPDTATTDVRRRRRPLAAFQKAQAGWQRLKKFAFIFYLRQCAGKALVLLAFLIRFFLFVFPPLRFNCVFIFYGRVSVCLSRFSFLPPLRGFCFFC